MVDNEHMMRLLNRRPRTTVLELSQHWRVIDGTIYRDCLVRDRRGELRTVGIRDELLGLSA